MRHVQMDLRQGNRTRRWGPFMSATWMVLFGVNSTGMLMVFLNGGGHYLALINQRVVVAQGFACGVGSLQASPILVRSCDPIREIAFCEFSDHVRVCLPIG